MSSDSSLSATIAVAQHLAADGHPRFVWRGSRHARELEISEIRRVDGGGYWIVTATSAIYAPAIGIGARPALSPDEAWLCDSCGLPVAAWRDRCPCGAAYPASPAAGREQTGGSS